MPVVGPDSYRRRGLTQANNALRGRQRLGATDPTCGHERILVLASRKREHSSTDVYDGAGLGDDVAGTVEGPVGLPGGP